LLTLRSLIFNILFWLNTFTLSAAIIILRPLGLKFGNRIGRLWSITNLFLLKIICGITYDIQFRGERPEGPVVYLAKHQSAWETIAFPALLPPFMWVLKRELMYIPIFGWCLMVLGHIGINRKAGRSAIKQINRDGKKILESGYNMVIFPEGTRMAPGERGTFNPGGVGLAISNGVPIVPVAHNAGSLWRKNAFAKRSGKITVIIDEAIETKGMSPSDRKVLTERVKKTIENRMKEIEI
jgi:1-acyl-sn-glycerol-3-phosphate acyltransferase